MAVTEPELITIVEGPTPDFHPTPQRWLQSIYEGPDDRAIAMCQLRTLKGEDILARCQNAWREGRPVRLDFPDRLRLRQQVDVVAMRLQQLEEGPLMLLWVSLPLEEGFDDDGLEGEEDDDEDDDLFYS